MGAELFQCSGDHSPSTLEPESTSANVLSVLRVWFKGKGYHRDHTVKATCGKELGSFDSRDYLWRSLLMLASWNVMEQMCVGSLARQVLLGKLDKPAHKHLDQSVELWMKNSRIFSDIVYIYIYIYPGFSIFIAPRENLQSMSAMTQGASQPEWEPATENRAPYFGNSKGCNHSKNQMCSSWLTTGD